MRRGHRERGMRTRDLLLSLVLAVTAFVGAVAAMTGSTPSGLDETSRFYAWATLEDATGTIVAADFAPDDAWTGIVLDRTSFP
jgi:hypothetical protein